MSCTKKVALYCSYGNSMTGGPQVVLNFIDTLNHKEFEPILITQKESELVQEARKRLVKVIIKPLPDLIALKNKKTLQYSVLNKFKSFFYLFKYNMSLKRILHENDIDILWARNIKSVLLAGFAARKLNIPLIWDIGLEPKSTGWFRLFHFLGLNVSTKIVTEAKNQKVDIFGSMLSKMYTNKILTISPGISNQKIKQIEENINIEYRGKEPFIILNVGTITPRKNQQMLLGVCNELINKHPEVRFKFIGSIEDDEYYKDLQVYVRENKLGNNIDFLGWRDDVPVLMGKANLLVMTSYSEGIPHVLHEAMQAKLPLILTDAGGMSETVQNNSNGYTVEIDDVNEMANYINFLIKDIHLATKMGEKSKEIVLNKYSIDKWAETYNKLMNTLINA